MGDKPFNLHYAGPQLHSQSYPPFEHNVPVDHIPKVEPEEDKGLIRCICGSAEDDGYTTQCDHCNTWQHVECYYGPNLQVPEVHECTICVPRELGPFSPDATKSRQKREHFKIDGEDRKPRRNGHKGHRKSKTIGGKELPTLLHAHTNGWSQHDVPSDHTNQDYTPPLKRPKTHHRFSNMPTDPHQNYHNQDQVLTPISQSPLKHPASEAGSHNLSAEYFRAYQDHESFTPTPNNEGNGYASIDVISHLKSCLPDLNEGPEGPLRQIDDTILNQEPLVRKAMQSKPIYHVDGVISPHLVATRAITTNELVGQVIGEIGLRADYIADPANNWDRLRHPDHFVMFHPTLHIYIDCRKSGSIMRFARRGCMSNVRVEVVANGDIAPGSTHIYLTATQPIKEDEEIVLGWKPVDEYLSSCIAAINKASDAGEAAAPDKHEYVVGWTRAVLSHFGGCACDDKTHAHCSIRNQENRSVAALSNSSTGRSAARRQWPQRSPGRLDHHLVQMTTNGGPIQHATAVDDDAQVSSERSSRSRTSRDATPVSRDTNGTPNGIVTEFTEREKRKLQDRMRVYEQQQKPRAKKKRRSGSHPSTPTAPLPKQSNLSRGLTPGQNELSPASRGPSSNIGSPARDVEPKSPGNAPASNDTAETEPEPAVKMLPRRPKPVYVDASIQTDPPAFVKSPSITPRRPFVSLSKRLLQRNHQRRAKMAKEALAGADVDASAGSSSLPSQSAIGTETYTSGSAEMSLSEPSTTASLDPVDHASTADSDEEPYSPPGPSTTDMINKLSDDAPHYHESSRPDTSADAPVAKAGVKDVADPRPQQRRPRPNDMHVDLPPPRFEGSLSTSITGAYTMSPSSEAVTSPPPNSATTPFTAPVAPMSASLLPPGTEQAVRPSPIKKKMSLAEYTSRKSKTPGTGIERKQSFGFPDVRAIDRRPSMQSTDDNSSSPQPAEPPCPP